MPTAVFVAFGRPTPPNDVDQAWARRELLDLGALAFDQRPVLRRHLARECARTLTKHPGRLLLVDRTAERRTLTCAPLFGAAAVLSRRIRATTSDQRVGIVLPPGI